MVDEERNRKNTEMMLKYRDLDEDEMLRVVMQRLNKKRNDKLTPEQRRSIALKAVQAREAKKKIIK